MNIETAFPSDYLKASDLNGHSIIVKMSHVEIEPVGKNKEQKPVLYFHGKEKGLVLNKTNSKKIVSIVGSADTDDWNGQEIALYPCMVEFAGEQVEGIRVNPPIAAKKAPPPPKDVDDSDIPF